MVLALDDPSIKTPLGELLRLPVKFIKGKTDAPAIAVSAIAQQLQATSKNVLPIIVKLLAEDKYEATLNAQILEAARQAKLDFVWCIVVNEAMDFQTQVEAGQALQINVSTASEKALVEMFEFIRSHKTGFSKLQPPLVAQAIVEYRKVHRLENLTFLTKLKCGIGKAKLSALEKHLTV